MLSKTDWNLLAESEENIFMALIVGILIKAAYLVW
jgi:hypothetical protein